MNTNIIMFPKPCQILLCGGKVTHVYKYFYLCSRHAEMYEGSEEL